MAAKGDLPRLQDHVRATYEWFRPQGVTVFPSAFLADVLLTVGDLVEVEAIVRAGLAAAGHATARPRSGSTRECWRPDGEPGTPRAATWRAHEIRPDLEEQPECMAARPSLRSFWPMTTQ